MTTCSGAAPAPFASIVSWNLTRRCNLACGHCYLDAVLRKTQAGDELETEPSLAVVRQIAQTAPGAMLVFTGGEPLLRRDLVRLVKAASDDGLMPVVGTNGTLLDSAKAASLRAAGAAGVGISLDSSRPDFHDRLRGVKGAWAGARRGIALARQAGLAIVFQTTVFEENRHDLAALADLAQRQGALAFNVFFLVCTGRGVNQTDLTWAAYEEALREIVRLQQDHPSLKIRARCAPYMRRLQGLHVGESGGGYADWSSACLAGRRYFRITPEGRVTPCPYIPAVVGDLRMQPLQQIWDEHPTLLRLRNELPQGKCGVCDFRYSCGGCRARALAEHGELLAPDSKCGYTPPPDRRPEAWPQAASHPRLAWDTDAQARLLRIPAFVRDRARTLLEASAIGEGVQTITAEFMMRHRPPADMLDRLRRPVSPAAGTGTIGDSE